MSPITELIGGAKAYGWGSFAAVGDFESIATVSLSSTPGTVSFTSIPNTYEHLQLRMLTRETSNLYTNTASLIFNFNSDGAGNYARHQVRGTGATVTAAALTSTTNPAFGYHPGGGAAAGIFGATVVDILDYKNTNKYKTVRSLNGNDSNGAGTVGVFSDVWMNTAAITSIQIIADQSFTANSRFALYGIKGA